METSFFDKSIFMIIIVFVFFIVMNFVVMRKTSTSKKIEKLPNLLNSQIEGPLHNYSVMSSWNSCVDNTYDVSLVQLRKVLYSGFRFLDFEVFFVDNKPRIAYSSSALFEYFNSVNSLLLFDVLNFIASTAFSDPVPNPNDPLFLHFRIRTRDPNVFEKMAEHLHGSDLFGKLYSGTFRSTSSMNALRGNTIIIVDAEYTPNVLTNDSCDENCLLDIKTLVHTYSNTSSLPSTRVDMIEDTNATDDNAQVNYAYTYKKLRMASLGIGPYLTSQNINYPAKMIFNHKRNFLPFKVYQEDEELSNYQQLFKTYGNSTAFINMYALSDDARSRLVEEEEAV